MTMIAITKTMEQFFTMIENKVNKNTRTKRKLDMQEDDDEESEEEMEKKEEVELEIYQIYHDRETF